jgi:hypothetical protein
MDPTSALDPKIGDARGRLRPDGKVVATTILVALVMCVFLSKLHESQPSKSIAPDARVVRIVDPAFCKDQTWPYIDQRCLKRIDASDGVVKNESVGSPANPTKVQPNVASSGMPTSVPGTVNVSINAVTAQTPSQAVTPQAITPQTPTQAGPAPTVVVPPALPAANALTVEPPGVREGNADAAMAAPIDRQMEDVSQHHPRLHSRRHAHIIFGFRF